MDNKKRKLLFLLNPKAGHGLNDKIVSLINEKIGKTTFEAEIKHTFYQGHATALADEAQKSDVETVIAVGGDGTVNETAKALVHSQTSLGVIPTGSGNGFARYFHIPLDPAKAIEVILKGNTIVVDSLTVNGKFCINIAGTGFDAHIADLFSSYGKRGLVSYTKLVIREYFGYHVKKYLIEFDKHKLERHAFLISFANGAQFGNGAKIAPLAKTDDGLIDLVIMKKCSLFSIPSAVAKIFAGTLHKTSFIEIYKSKIFKVSGNDEMIMHIDGEPSGKYFEIKASINPGTNKLIIPN